MSQRRQESHKISCGENSSLNFYLSHGEPGYDFAVLYVHGLGSAWSGEKSRALEAACARRGWNFAAFDFRGHGASSGSLSEMSGSSLLADLEAVDSYLAGSGIARILPVGSSMGAWTAAWFTLRHPHRVPACVLIAPAFDFPSSHWNRLSEREQIAWKQTGRCRIQNEWLDTEIGFCLVAEAHDFPVESLTARWYKPALIFHGMQDDIVPYRTSIELIDRVACPAVELHLFKCGDHRLVNFKEEIAEGACRFLARWGTASEPQRADAAHSWTTMKPPKELAK
jgi:pimeloyl-ACP methyl ester carboxylesterase